MAVLGKALIGTKDIIRETREAQRLSLFFDSLAIWSLSRKQMDAAEGQRVDSEIEYLRSEGVVATVGIDVQLPINIKTANGVVTKNPFGDRDIRLPIGWLSGDMEKEKFEFEADAVVYRASKFLRYNDAPVVAHVNPTSIPESAEHMVAGLEVCIRAVPMPDEDMPWETFLDFRRDAENIAKLRALRLWVQKRATSEDSAAVMKDELEALLWDYEKYMKIQKVKFTRGVISTLLTATAQIVAASKLLPLAGGLGKLLEVRSHNLALEEAELKAPGREVAFVSSARTVLSETPR